MSNTAAVPVGDQGIFKGTPRSLPFVLLCQADVNFCGRTWIVNNWAELDDKTSARNTHEVLCSARGASAGIITALGAADHAGLLVARR